MQNQIVTPAVGGGSYAERDLKIIALHMAALLPDNKDAALQTHDLLKALIDDWLYKDKS
jgi:hypothetical protein